MPRAPFELAGATIKPGSRLQVDVPVARLYTHAPLHIPVEVVHGRRQGPVMLVCGGIHGDEINSVEIVRRLMRSKQIQGLHGTLIAVPIVNVFGFMQHSRYLPDRRDLNRCFPGSETGSLGARVAALFREQIVDHATHIIDLHTGAIHRTNLPQIRAQLSPGSETERMANAFGAPVILNAELREGSLRHYAQTRGIPVLTYEAGEALRFDEVAIRIGVRGVMNVLREMNMLRSHMRRALPVEPVVAHSSTWVRAPMSGVLRSQVRLGHAVTEGQRVGWVGDPVGGVDTAVYSHTDGIVIGGTGLPLVHEGDALFHIARVEAPRAAARAVTEARRMAQAMPGARARFD